MAKFERGKPIPASDLNEAARNAEIARGATAQGAALHIGPGGMAISVPRTRIPNPNCVAARFYDPCLDGSGSCEQDSVAPLFGVVEVYDALNTRTSTLITHCRIPSQCGFASIGSIQERGAAPSHITQVQTHGIGRVLYLPGTVPPQYQSKTRYRLGCYKNSHYARYDRLGPMLFLKDLGAAPSAGGSGSGPYESVHVAEVEFTGERGDEKIANTQGKGADGPYYTYIWSDAYVVEEKTPGNVSVKMA